MTRSYGTGTGTNLANPDLGTEDMTGWELGTDYNKGGLSVGATYFLYNIKNMIATYRVNATDPDIPAPVIAICGAPAGAPLRFPNCNTSATALATSVNYYTNDQNGQSHGLELTGTWKAKRHAGGLRQRSRLHVPHCNVRLKTSLLSPVHRPGPSAGPAAAVGH